MIKYITKETRVFNFISRLSKQHCWNFDDAPDPRMEEKTKHSICSIYSALFVGLLTNQRTLRDVESQTTKKLNSLIRTWIPDPISDTTLDTEARRLDIPYLSNKLITQIRNMHRSKMLKPQGLPCGVLTIDGKNLATLSHDAEGTGHPRSTETEKWYPKKMTQEEDSDKYHLMPALRANLSSAEAKPCVYQHAIPSGKGEAKVFKQMVDAVDEAYKKINLFKIIDGDAGFTSIENATYIHQKGYYYFFGLKNNQPILFEKAKAYLRVQKILHKPAAQTD